MAATVAATLTVTASVFSSLLCLYFGQLVARFAKAEGKESVFHAQLSLTLFGFASLSQDTNSGSWKLCRCECGWLLVLSLTLRETAGTRARQDEMDVREFRPVVQLHCKILFYITCTTWRLSRLLLTLVWYYSHRLTALNKPQHVLLRIECHRDNTRWSDRALSTPNQSLVQTWVKSMAEFRKKYP